VNITAMERTNRMQWRQHRRRSAYFWRPVLKLSTFFYEILGSKLLFTPLPQLKLIHLCTVIHGTVMLNWGFDVIWLKWLAWFYFVSSVFEGLLSRHAILDSIYLSITDFTGSWPWRANDGDLRLGIAL